MRGRFTIWQKSGSRQTDGFRYYDTGGHLEVSNNNQPLFRGIASKDQGNPRGEDQ